VEILGTGRKRRKKIREVASYSMATG